MEGGVDSEDVGGVALEACNWAFISYRLRNMRQVVVRYHKELCPLPLRPREEPNVDAFDGGLIVSGAVDTRELLRDSSSGSGVGSTICSDIKVSCDAEASGF